MTEAAPVSAATGGAGAQLRAARERQGLHIAALAAMIKIPQRKLEALEADRFDELPDATFTRALAMTVCRALKIDAAPVLAQLPQAAGTGLSGAKGGLNTPFRERPGRSEPAESATLRHPLAWAALCVLAVAAAVFLLPREWWPSWGDEAAPAPASIVVPVAPVAPPASASAPDAPASPVAEAASAPVAAGSAPAVEVVHSAPSAEVGTAARADVPSGVAVLRAVDASWVEVVDAGGQVLVQRTLQAGESIGLDGRLPFRLKIGNAAGTELVFRGQPVDLAPLTRDNVARFELK
jgi:cytoskeleton protein RodZ